MLGVTFGLGWAPCIGPTFAAVQTLVFTGGAATFKAVVLTFAYCLGLGVPFLLVAYFAARGVNTTGWASTHKRGIQRAGGAMLSRPMNTTPMRITSAPSRIFTHACPFSQGAAPTWASSTDRVTKTAENPSTNRATPASIRRVWRRVCCV